MFIGTPVFRLVIDKVLRLRATVPERYVGLVNADQVVQVRVEAWPDRVFEGRIARVSPTVDRASRTFQIEARVPNASRELKAGGFAKISILTHVDPNGLTVPVESLVSFAGTTKVYVVRDAKAQAVPVTPGASGRGWIEVRGSLTAADQVITSGHNRLADGVPVTVRPPLAQGNPP